MGWVRMQDWEKLEQKKTDEDEEFAPVTYDLWSEDASDKAKTHSELARLRAKIQVRLWRRM